MIANYGYKDGSGEYFISVDTDKCAECAEKACVEACPAGVLEVIINDYDEEVVAVKEEHRKTLKYSCGPCKPVGGPRNVPCEKACETGALIHSW